MTLQYTLDDFYKINAQGFNVVLPQSVVDKINDLVKHVGSPNYIRTPIFHKPPKINTSNKKRKERDSKQIINTQEIWDKMSKKNIAENTTDEISVHNLRTHLNKLTDKNINDVTVKITNMLDTIIEQNNNEMLETITKSIFDIASSNKFLSGVYADLYSILYTKYEVTHKHLEKNYETFMDNFKHINYVSPEEDYDAFCKINKENDKRRSLTTFYLNLYCVGVFPIERIEKLLVNIFNMLIKFIQIPDKLAEVEEYTENIAILYRHDLEYSSKCLLSNGKSIRDTVIWLANTKKNTYPSLASKPIFKFMDICGI